MSYQLAMIHTVPGLIPKFEALAKEHLPGWSTFNIADESLLKHTIRDGALSKTTMRRIAGYISSAEEAGADAILVTCSSVGPAVDAAQVFCSVPLVRVDEGMADRASEIGHRIGVLATLSTTLNPTRDLIARIAAAKGKSPEIVSRVCEGAFDCLVAGYRDQHDKIVAANILALAEQVDVLVLAQASMAAVLEGKNAVRISVPVLSSPELGVRRLKSRLDELEKAKGA